MNHNKNVQEAVMVSVGTEREVRLRRGVAVGQGTMTQCKEKAWRKTGSSPRRGSFLLYVQRKKG